MGLFSKPKCPLCGCILERTNCAFPYPEWMCRNCIRISELEKQIKKLKNNMIEKEFQEYQCNHKSSLLKGAASRQNEIDSLVRKIKELDRVIERWYNSFGDDKYKLDDLRESNGWIREKMPDFDGEYLCLIVRKEICGNLIKYQKVVNCSMNKWNLLEGESVLCFMELPLEPETELTLV